MEAEVRDYLRADETIMGLLNGDEKRLNMDWTGNVNATHLTLFRAGGNVNGYYPYDLPVMIIHVYGSTRSAAADLAYEVGRAIRDISMRNAPLLSADVESIVYLPTTDGVARYVVTSVVTARFGPTAA
jgi:hypothetical protein